MAHETESQGRRKRGNTCKNKFSQDICVDFVVTFGVNIQDVEIEDVTCGGGN
ncbi:MAG: hypothetical protein ACOCRB_01440 [Halanaerobiaceae bacterium]